MPEESPKEITAAEGLDLGANVLHNMADALRDPETPKKISRTEWLTIGQKAVMDAWEAYQN